MLIIKLIRFLIGYVTFEGFGGFPERFVNLCTKNKIPLWNIKNHNKSIVADTTIGGYKNIRQSAYRSGVRVHIVKKHGLPFFVFANKSRKGIAVGLVIAVIIIMYFSSTIWTVTVEGNKTVSKEEILTVFSDLGVDVGARRSSIEPSEVADEAEKKIDKLLWASVNIRGSRAEIVVCERTDAPEFPDTQTPCNILADEDGIICGVEAEIGKAEVKTGDAVLKGDLLISGITENLDKTQSLKTARGNVYAIVEKNIIISDDIPVFNRQSGERTRFVVSLFGLKIPLGLSVGENNFSSTEKYAYNGNIKLPVGIIKQHSYYYENESELPEEYKMLYCAKLFADEYKTMYQQNEIRSSSFSSSFDGGGDVFKGRYECKKEIGIVSPIFVENN